MRSANSMTWRQPSVCMTWSTALPISTASEAPMWWSMNVRTVLAVRDSTCVFHRIRRNWAARGGDQIGERTRVAVQRPAAQVVGVVAVGRAPRDHVRQGVTRGEGRQAALIRLDRDHGACVRTKFVPPVLLGVPPPLFQ